MSHDIANCGEILLYDITVSILETVRQDTMYISEFDRSSPLRLSPASTPLLVLLPVQRLFFQGQSLAGAIL